MPRNTKAAPATSRKVLGLGFLPGEARHGFVVDISRGAAKGDPVFITELRGSELSRWDVGSVLEPTDTSLRVAITRERWLELAPAFWEEANRRLRANGLPAHKFQKSAAKPVPIHASLGKELCILCWAVEDAPLDDIPNAIRNWEVLAPEERWWLFTMTVATTGQAMQKGLGWRKALRAALADNPFVKGEGMSPRARRELLGHSQLTLSL
jgi:hypothetical protein